MNKKRYLSISMCLALGMGMLFGYGKCEALSADTQGDAADAGKELEFMEISVSHWDGDTAFGSNDEVITTIEEKFNVDFVSQNITWDDHTQKIQLWASTNSLADISASYVRDTQHYYEWAEEGIIRPLPEDLSAYPNVEAWMKQDAASNAVIDGKYYCIPKIVYTSQEETVQERVLLYRWDLAQQVGITKEPETWDEFRDMLKAIIEADPEGKKIGGLTSPGMDYMLYHFLAYSVPNACGNRWVDNNGTYVPAYFAGQNLGDDILPAWNLLRDMYTEGTIDPDLAISTIELAVNKFLNGQAAALCVTGSIAAMDASFGMESGWRELHGDELTDDCRILNLLPGADGETYYWETPYSAAESIFSSNVDDEKMERILMIYDYLLSDEGKMLSRYGIEGDTYEIVDGQLVADTAACAEKYPSTTALCRMVSWVVPLPNGYKIDGGYDDWFDEWVPGYIEQAAEVEMPPYSREAYSAFVQLGTGFTYSSSDDALRIMTSTEPVEDIWNTILDEYRQDGLEDVIAQVNEAMK